MTRTDFSQATLMVSDEPDVDLLKHFSHFMLQYFVDVALWCHDHPGRHVVVVDCGPCTPWFDLLTAAVTVTVLSPSQMDDLAKEFPLNVCLVDSRRGFAHKKSVEKLQRFRDTMTAGISDHQSPRARVFARRTTDPSRYRPGAWMRRIDNEDRLAGVLHTTFKFEAVEFFDTSVRDAVDVMSRCEFFVAQRGAALMNLLFMPAGATVVEIYPRDFEATGPRVDMYRRACAALSLRFVRVYQRNKFSAVSPLRLFFVILWIRLTSR